MQTVQTIFRELCGIILRNLHHNMNIIPVYGRVNHVDIYVTVTDVDLAFYPSWDGKLSISFRAD